MVAVVVASTGCSSETQGESLGGVEQGLGAGEFALLNEVELNPPGGDAPWQYIEIEGTPGASLATHLAAAPPRTVIGTFAAYF